MVEKNMVFCRSSVSFMSYLEYKKKKTVFVDELGQKWS